MPDVKKSKAQAAAEKMAASRDPSPLLAFRSPAPSVFNAFKTRYFRGQDVAMELMLAEYAEGYAAGKARSTAHGPQWRSMAFVLLGDPNLWRLLEALYGKADGMVPGKYRKARAFCFDEPHFHAIFILETGARGNTMLAAAKPTAPAGAPSAQDLADFVRNLATDLASASPELRVQCIEIGLPGFREKAESEAIGREVATPEPGRKRTGL